MDQKREHATSADEIRPASITDSLLWPFEAARLAVDTFAWWLDQGLASVDRRDEALPWTTPNKVALELISLRLRDFSYREAERAVLVCAPYTLHGALLADFAPGHSIIEGLRRGGAGRLYLTDWRSASAEMRFLSIDNYLADLNVAIDAIAPPVDLIGLCQGGWLSLLYAARFPEKVRRLVLVGSPVDVSIESELSRIVARAPQAAFEGLVSSGGGLVRGDHMLRFWSRPPDVEAALQKSLSRDVAGDNELLDRFGRWHGKTLDLPGLYYLQVVNWIFRQNRLANGTFVALGQHVQLERLKIPVFLLAGADDEVVPAAQAMATAPLLGTPAASIARAVAPSTHLGLFMGARTVAVSWPRISGWLRGGGTELLAREIASSAGR